jgi:hypothetical protein
MILLGFGRQQRSAVPGDAARVHSGRARAMADTVGAAQE